MVTIHRTSDLKENLQIINSKQSVIIAGGTDIMVHYNHIENQLYSKYKNVVSIDLIDELKNIEVVNKNISRNKESGDYLKIGSMVTLSEMEQHPDVPMLIKQLIPQMAAPAIRNRATLGGNICNASPAADTLPALYILNALVVLSSVNGERVLPIEEFICGPGKTLLEPSELLTSVLIPRDDLSIHFYYKVGTRSANALTKLSVAGVAKIEKSCANCLTLTDWRISFGAVGPTVMRDKKLESTIIGLPVSCLTNQDLVNQLVENYSNFISPIDDQRSTADYRRHTAIKLMVRWIQQLAQMK